MKLAILFFALLPVSDPTLDALIHDALANNHDLRVAAARVQEARALRGITASQRKPQVNGAALAAESGQRHSRDNFFDAGFDASWEIDWLGAVRRDVDAAVAQVQATDEGRRDVEITLIADVARNYVELRGAQNRLDVLDARVETLRQSLDIVRSRQNAGLTTDFDVVRSEALLDDTLAARPSLEFASEAAVQRLAVLTGRKPEELQLAAHEPIPAVADLRVSREAVKQRPDVRRAEHDLDAATARIDVARADLFPRISLFGGFGRRSDDVGRYWSFGPQIRWPLLTGGRVRAQIGAAHARREQADEALQETILLALEDVGDSTAAYARDRRERDRLAAAVAAESRAVELAESRYRAGLDNFLTVLDAQRTLRDGEDRLATAETHVAVSAIAVYKSVGGGLQ